jgi:DNA-binding MarR family transcriptional regulator
MTTQASELSIESAGDPNIVEGLHWQLFRLAASYRRRDQEQIAVGALTLTQSSMLFALRVCGPMRLGELAALEKVTAATTTQAVSRLESLGLVTRTRGSLDQRTVRIEITPAGDALQRSSLEGLLQVMTDALSEDEMAALCAALAPLERITRALETGARAGSAANETV